MAALRRLLGRAPQRRGSVRARDRVVLRVTTRARQSGEFNGIPASGREVVFAGIVIYRFRDAKIAESWGELDFAGLWRQLNEQPPEPSSKS